MLINTAYQKNIMKETYILMEAYTTTMIPNTVRRPPTILFCLGKLTAYSFHLKFSLVCLELPQAPSWKDPFWFCQLVLRIIYVQFPAASDVRPRLGSWPILFQYLGPLTKLHYKRKNLKEKQHKHSGTQQIIKITANFPLIFHSVCSLCFFIFFALIELWSW